MSLHFNVIFFLTRSVTYFSAHFFHLSFDDRAKVPNKCSKKEGQICDKAYECQLELFSTFSLMNEVYFVVEFCNALSTIKVTRSKCAIDDNDVYSRTIFFALSTRKHSLFLHTVNFWTGENHFKEGIEKKGRVDSKQTPSNICEIEYGWGQKKFSSYNLVSTNGYLPMTTLYDYPN